MPGGGGSGFNPGVMSTVNIPTPTGAGWGQDLMGIFGTGGSDYGGFNDSGIWGSQIWNFLRPSITSYPSSYNRHFFRDRGTRKGKFRTRKKINDYYKGDETYRTENPLTPQDVADFKRLQEQGKIKEDKLTGEEFLDEEWRGLTSEEMYEKLGIDPDADEKSTIDDEESSTDWGNIGDLGGSSSVETGGLDVDWGNIGNILSNITGILGAIKGGEGDVKRSAIWAILSNILGGGFGGGAGTGGTGTGGTGTGGTSEENEGIMGLLEDILGIFYPQIFGPGQGMFSGGDSSWLDKIYDFLLAKQAIKEYNKYEVPVGQMHAQSTVGEDWKLPTKGSMVMEDLGPNFAENMQYLMAKGKPTPAATHALGTPFVEKVEEIPGAQQGGIMGLEGLGDITPAFLEPGEFVFTKDATDNIGAKRLYKLMKQAEQMGMGGG